MLNLKKYKKINDSEKMETGTADAYKIGTIHKNYLVLWYGYGF